MTDGPRRQLPGRRWFDARLTRRAFGAAGLALAGRRLAAPRARIAHAQTPVAPTGQVKAIYMNPMITTSADGFFALVDIIDRTELNALVIDVKEEGVYVDTQVSLYRDSNAVNPSLDVAGALRTLHKHAIRPIARLVVFKDNAVAAARPDLAVIDTNTGQPWIDAGGNAWLNPFKIEVWDAATALGEELAKQGFAEIQFDYVRFPSDGDLSVLDFRQTVDEGTRVKAISGFLGAAHRRLAAVGAQTGADVFGFTLLLDDIGIGQNVRKLRDAVDWVCPMVYPSHFPDGSIDVPGQPNDYPAQTIEISLDAGADRIPVDRLRPWLQDFTLPGMSPYGAPEVRAQIDAAEAAGAEGWMIWNASNEYHVDAFHPAPA
ncbi:MAG TPA: putative glycoside hydrolase, partial [Thermomicrobiales bacterium]|nr:putative glycoside hydrolase [Thermomicrobiales bacterium]